MEQKFLNEETWEQVILVGVETADVYQKEGDFERSMEELIKLSEACFMKPVAVVTQKMELVNKGLYIGTGKVQEVKELVRTMEAELVIFDNSLTPSQLRNLQEELACPVMDRTNLILDIFESRAKTREAKLQVETARLQYLLPRLVGMHEALTRQGGTSGSMSSRGIGEKKLELDRRRIEHRLSELRKELEGISGERLIQRKKRRESRIPLVALVGYTNAGKSTIMNGLVEKYVGEEDKKVLEKDMLFATLDTTVRRISTGNNRDFLLSDTVGFIDKLPHSLVKAFRSTLEEVQNADLLLHVVDCSDDYYREQMSTTVETLRELEAGDIPVITVYNKADKCKEPVVFPKSVGDKIYLSAREDGSLTALTDMILEKIYAGYVRVTFLIPYEKGNLVSYFMENAQIISQDYEENGTRLTVKCYPGDRDKYSIYIVKEA